MKAYHKADELHNDTAYNYSSNYKEFGWQQQIKAILHDLDQHTCIIVITYMYHPLFQVYSTPNSRTSKCIAYSSFTI